MLLPDLYVLLKLAAFVPRLRRKEYDPFEHSTRTLPVADRVETLKGLKSPNSICCTVLIVHEETTVELLLKLLEPTPANAEPEKILNAIKRYAFFICLPLAEWD